MWPAPQRAGHRTLLITTNERAKCERVAKQTNRPADMRTQHPIQKKSYIVLTRSNRRPARAGEYGWGTAGALPIFLPALGAASTSRTAARRPPGRSRRRAGDA